ncbi:MAG: CBS domain-containing protein [Thermodesulfobacteriota bacterium]
MDHKPECGDTPIPCPIDLSDKDIYDAMKKIPGYLDITPGDFKEIYILAFQHARERLTRSFKAKDVMTGEVVYVTPETPLKDVAASMARHAISGVPVVDENRKVVGVVSEKDFLSHMGTRSQRTFMGVVAECLQGTGCLAVSILEQTAADIMTSPAVTVEEDTSILEVSDAFAKWNINRVPVVDKETRLVGILSRADVLHHVC